MHINQNVKEQLQVSAAVADWDEFVEIVINTFDDKTYSYQEYQIKAALSDNEFALAKYVNEKWAYMYITFVWFVKFMAKMVR